MLKVMIAEDDLLMADILAEVLIESGYEVCGIARTVEEAVDLGERHKPDLAVLDLRLANGGLGTDIGARLNRPGRPGILYATGNVGQITLKNAVGEACLGKPYKLVDLVRALDLVQEIAGTGQASRPFPKAFHVLEHLPSSDAAPDQPSKDAERPLRQQAALASFGSFALGEGDLGAVLMEAARVCAEGLDVPFCKICRYRPEENDLLVEAGVGWHSGVIGRVVSRADESSPQGRAFITGQPVICRDLTNDNSFALPSFYAEHGIISTIDVIIKGKDGKPYGVLEIDNPKQHDYDRHDVAFLTGFANVLAEAVNTSKRNALLQGTIDALKGMIGERDRMLAEKISMLDEKNRLLAERQTLGEELQHRVRNNLQLVYGMLSKQLRTTADGAGKEGISAIARRVMTLSQVYDHLLGTGLTPTIDFGGYLSSLCASFQSLEHEEHRNIGLVCHSAPMILDLDSVTALGLVVAELISNSYLHAFPDGSGTITVSLHMNESAAEGTIIFADDGIGFAKNGETTRHGMGLVKRLMQQVSGSAEVSSEHGAMWTLIFPVPTLPMAGASRTAKSRDHAAAPTD